MQSTITTSRRRKPRACRSTRTCVSTSLRTTSSTIIPGNLRWQVKASSRAFPAGRSADAVRACAGHDDVPRLLHGKSLQTAGPSPSRSGAGVSNRRCHARSRSASMNRWKAAARLRLHVQGYAQPGAVPATAAHAETDRAGTANGDCGRSCRGRDLYGRIRPHKGPVSLGSLRQER